MRILYFVLLSILIAGIVAFTPIIQMAIDVVEKTFDPTRYSSGFSKAGFEKIQIGDRVDDVLRRLGPPISRHPGGKEEFVYTYDGLGIEVHADRDRAALEITGNTTLLNEESRRQLDAGVPVIEVLGADCRITRSDRRYSRDSHIEGWEYSRPGSSGSFWICVIIVDLEQERVIDKIRRWHRG